MTDLSNIHHGGQGISKVLVTGGTGFLGAYVIKELMDKGYKVRATRRSAKVPFFIPQIIFDKVEWVDSDVLDVVGMSSAIQGVDAVVHSAAIVSFDRKKREEMYKINIEGTANVVNICLESGVKKMVHVSSIAALGRTAKGDKVDESKAWVNSKWNTHYAITKQRSEMEVWRGIAEGLNAVIVNPSTILGFGDWNQGSCAIFKRIYKGFTWYTNGVNGFVDVEDVARSVVLLMESSIAGERFIINSENWEFKKLFDAIADGFGKVPPSREAGPLLSGFAWRMEMGKSFFTEQAPLLTRETSLIALSKTYFQNDKILRYLKGFYFTPLKESVYNACKKYEQWLEAMQLKV